MGRYRVNDTGPERGSDIAEVELLRATRTTSRRSSEAHDQAVLNVVNFSSKCLVSWEELMKFRCGGVGELKGG
jgi:hypothetical protein